MKNTKTYLAILVALTIVGCQGLGIGLTDIDKECNYHGVIVQETVIDGQYCLLLDIGEDEPKVFEADYPRSYKLEAMLSVGDRVMIHEDSHGWSIVEINGANIRSRGWE